MKYIFVEQFFVLINPVWGSLPVHTMTDFGPTHYLKIYLNNSMYTYTSLSVSSLIMASWVGASENKHQ